MYDTGYYATGYHSTGYFLKGLVAVVKLVHKISREAHFKVVHNAAVQFMVTKTAQAAWQIINAGSRGSFGVMKLADVPYANIISASASFKTRRSERATIPRSD